MADKNRQLAWHSNHNDTYIEEFSSVLVTVIDSDAAAENANVKANSEVSGEHGESRAILLQDHLSLKENALRGSAVHLSRLTDHDRVVLQVIEDRQFPNPIVFEAALDNALLEVARES